MISYQSKIRLMALAASTCVSGAWAAPVVVQKGSTAQYIYIPAGSVPGSGTGGGGNDGATAAKQFCKRFITQDLIFTVPKDLMLDPTVKFGGVAIGGGSGSNSSRGFTDPDTGVTTWKYASGGGGGSTGVLVDGVPIAVAAGADASTGENTGGLAGARVAVPEFTATRSGAGTHIRIIIGGGGGAGGPDWSYGTYGQATDLNSGTGARGFYGGGGGARIVSATSLSTMTWPTPARGGTASLGGTGAVAPMRGDSRSNGTMGGSMTGGNGTGGAGSRAPNTGRLMYGQAVVSGWMQLRYEYISHLPSYPYEQNVSVTYNSTQTLSAVSSYSVVGSAPIDESNMMNFGVGSTNPSSSGTAGMVYLYYSAPTCNLIPY